MEASSLDNISKLIAGVEFAGVTEPSNRATVVKLAMLNEISEDIRGGRESIAELVEYVRTVAANTSDSKVHLETIGDSLVDVGKWFEKSKLWDGL